ncbi:MAG: peptidoglycan DD-metalloendopeptidase family protein [Bacteroidales bacterium]|nr:peptidoglycan DD-metalloendopeptidase family protein [Bacteroidales bacterium]
MNKKTIIYASIIFLFFCFSKKTFAQSKLEKAEKELNKARNLLKSLDKKSTRTFTKFKIRKKQIELQENLLKNIKIEISNLEKEIEKNTERKEELQKEIKRLQSEYEELILYAYKTRKTRDKTMYIFSAKTFSQAYRRFVYLQYLTEYLEETTKDLEIKNDSISIINEHLISQKDDKLLLKEKQTDELIRLNESKKILSNILNNLQTKKAELIAEVKRKEKIAASLRKSIKKNVGTNTSAKKTKLSLNFEKNKGRFPFPVKGIITSSFGKHTHSVLKNVQVNNDGIEIASAKGEKVKAIHPGVISQVLKIPGGQNAIIIKHGQYYSVYSNMQDVYVSKGAKVKRGEAIGTPNARILNFQIWFQNKKLNPQKWLK